jgi:hypothetical protein
MERNIRRDIMAFSSTNFMAYVNNNNGLAEGFRFRVTVPRRLDGNDILEFMCQEAVIPGKEIETMEKTYGYGTTRQLPKSEKYENVNLKIKCTNGKVRGGGYPEWNYFYNWMEDVIETGTNVVGWRENYAEDVFIDTYSGGDWKVHQVQLPNAYPIKIGDIPLSGEQKEVDFEVTLSCDYVIHNKQIKDHSTRVNEDTFGRPGRSTRHVSAFETKWGVNPDEPHEVFYGSQGVTGARQL